LKALRRSLALVASFALVMSTVGAATGRAPAGEDGTTGSTSDNLKSPFADRQANLRDKAAQRVMTGQATATGKNKVVRLGDHKFVELAREGEDSILTVLAEFGTTEATHSHFGGPFTHLGGPGPLHNRIPEPDRTVDNTTIWEPDFSEPYFENLLFSEAPGANTMRNYYIEQSSGRYAVNGDVTPWVQVPNNAAAYGSNYCGGIACQDTWRFVNDAVDAFAGTFADTAALNAYLSAFDVWDRYDADGDGNFDEPDGYIDHYQSVHAGEGEETGGGAQGSDAIWSHRWYAHFLADGPDGPGVNGFGGVQIGDSDFWIGDYTVEPENGGVGVFAHEFGHDLGLPDLYDTSGNTGGAENSTGFWTSYSHGTYGSSGRPADGIGTRPVHMGNYEKLSLGWLNYETVYAGQRSSHRMGPAEFNTSRAQGVLVVLPDRVVTVNIGDPCPGCGSAYFYSGEGDSLNNTMTVPVGAGGELTAQVRYETEENWDYAFLEASADGGTTWTPLATNQSDSAAGDQSALNVNASGTGMSGSTGGLWTGLTATLPAGSNALRFRYITDEAVTLPGFQVDQIAIDGGVIGTAESDEGWAFVGFSMTTGTQTQTFFNAYILSNRQYIGFDRSLRTGPYNFGYGSTLPSLVEHFPYQRGLLVEYWNSQYNDNNVGDHPGEGLVLPVDAHPELTHWPDGSLLRPRILSADSAFGLDRVPRLTVHKDGVAVTIPSKPANPVFNDAINPWPCPAKPIFCPGAPGHYQPGWYSVSIPNTGTRIRVRSIEKDGLDMRIDINR
jgi:immune inhibitor A